MNKKIPALNTNSVRETQQEILYMDLARLIGFFDVMDRYLHLRLEDYDSWLKVTAIRFVITRGGALTPGQLAKIMLRSKNSISNLINGLENDGLIERVHSRKDHRVVIIKVTSKGLKFAMDRLNRLSPLQKELSDCLDDGELSTLVGLTRKLRLKLIENMTGLKSKVDMTALVK
jgi:DNA-binding MarR family transcriptional regulator